MDPIIEMFDNINGINERIKSLREEYSLEEGYIIDVEIMPILSKENRVNQTKGVDIRYAYKYLVTFYISQEEL